MALKNELTITGLLNRVPRKESTLYDLFNAMIKEIDGVDNNLEVVSKLVAAMNAATGGLTGIVNIYVVMKRVSLRI